MPWQLALLGAVPALLAMLYFDWLDRERPEPRRTLRVVAIVGALSVLPVLGIELLLEAVGPPAGTIPGAVFRAFVVAGSTEELAKLACVWFFVWRRPEFDERMDGITYGARAGLGFALVENVSYLMGAESAGGYVWMFIGRAVLAVPGHAIWGALMGYFAARRRFDGRGIGILGGLALAVLLHGLYDAALFVAPLLVDLGKTEFAGLLCLVPIVVIAGGAVTLRVLVRRSLEADDVDDRLRTKAEEEEAFRLSGGDDALHVQDGL